MSEIEKFGLSDHDYFATVPVQYSITEEKIGEILPKRRKFGKLIIYLKSREVGDPHFHIEDANGEIVVRVKLKEAVYQRDSYEKNGKKNYLSMSEKQALNDFIKKLAPPFNISNWQLMCTIWNNTVDGKNKIDETLIKNNKIPNYLNILDE